MFLAAKGGSLAPSQAIGPTSVSSLVAAIAAATLSPSPGSPARFMTSTAISNSAWTKPIGCVHCRPVALVKPSATCAELSPVSDDLNGWLGVHQTSDDRLWPDLPSASTDCGNSSALPIEATLGVKPCCLAWFQKVVKSGGIITPVMISHDAPLKALICAEKSSVRFW